MEAGVTKASHWYHCDEMRFGLWGQVRRRWGRRGIKIVQKIQIKFAWQYLVLAVDVMRGELRWAWSARMNQAHLMPIFEKWLPDVVIWDGASAHRGQAMGKLGFQCILLPAYSPELNPAERIFEEIRREVEGITYPSLAAKRSCIDQFLRRLRADKPRLHRLIAWQWIGDAYAQLPDP